MKRIVREVSDWKQVGNIVNVWPEYDINKPFKMQVKAVNTDSVILFDLVDAVDIKADLQGFFQIEGINHRVEAEDQITFEQALDELEDNPIAILNERENLSYHFGKPHHKVGWAEGWSRSNFVIRDIRDDTYFLMFEDCNNLGINLFQAESYDDLHLNVIPQLIRMARGG